MKRFDFQLAIQLGISIDETFKEDADLQRILTVLKEEGFYGIELNVVDFEKTNPVELSEFVKGFGLNLTMIATGGYSKRNGLFLCDSSESNRMRCTTELLKILNFAEKADCGVICGFMKGPGNQNYKEASEQFRKSLDQIQKEGSGGADLYIEVTNHYEATVANRAEEAEYLLANRPQWFRILLDTYHMNIEETCIEAELMKPVREGKNVHLSDNNRKFPGYGGMDFYKILYVLKRRCYCGVVTIEGNTSGNLIEDVRGTAAYLESISRRLKNTG